MSTQVLIYHGMTDAGGGTNNLHILPKHHFTEQLDHLKQNHCSVMSWHEFDGQFAGAGQPRVALTFDDGYYSDMESARVLHSYGFDALFFVATEYIGKPGYVSQDNIVELKQMGMGIGSHAHHHAMMAPLSDSAVELEFKESKQILEDILETSILHFSFPGGSYEPRMLRIGRRLGYRYFFTSEWGVNGPKQYMSGVFRRTSILNHTNITEFDAMLRLRSYYARQVVFHAKELAKKVAGEERYVKLRQTLLSLIRSR